VRCNAFAFSFFRLRCVDTARRVLPARRYIGFLRASLPTVAHGLNLFVFIVLAWNSCVYSSSDLHTPSFAFSSRVLFVVRVLPVLVLYVPVHRTTIAVRALATTRYSFVPVGSAFSAFGLRIATSHASVADLLRAPSLQPACFTIPTNIHCAFVRTRSLPNG